MDKIDVCSFCDDHNKIYFSTTEKHVYMIFKSNGEIMRIQMFENEIYKIFSNIVPDDIRLLGLNKEIFHQNLIINVLPVLPPVSRPYVRMKVLLVMMI